MGEGGGCGKVWLLDSKEAYLVFVLVILSLLFTACSLSTTPPQAKGITATAQLPMTSSAIPTSLPLFIPTVRPIPTITPAVSPSPTVAPTVEAPQFWAESRGVLEQNGYDLVQSVTGWEIQYEGQTVFTDKEA
jgi:hypothetical protein